MKRILALLLVGIMLLSLCSCSKKDTTSEPDTVETLTTIMESDDIVVKGSEGAFPENTVVKAEKVNEGDKFTTANTALKETATKFQLYDITAMSDNVAVQPNGTVKATFYIPNDFDTDKVAVVYISDDGNVITLASTVDAKSKTVTVELSHFSLYAIIEVIETNTTESTDDTEQTESTDDTEQTESTDDTEQTESTITDSSSETSTPSSSSSKPTESSKPVTASENGGSGDTEQDGQETPAKVIKYDIYYDDNSGDEFDMHMFYVFEDDLTKAEWYGSYLTVEMPCGCPVGSQWNFDLATQTVVCPCGTTLFSNPSVFTEVCNHESATQYTSNYDITHSPVCDNCSEVLTEKITCKDTNDDNTCDICNGDSNIKEKIIYLNGD